jgi:hypothetical protein
VAQRPMAESLEWGKASGTWPADTPHEHDGCVAAKRSAVTAAEFEQLTAAEAECLLRQRLRVFAAAGAEPCEALLLAAQIEIDANAVVQLLKDGFSADLTLRLLYAAA